MTVLFSFAKYPLLLGSPRCGDEHLICCWYNGSTCFTSYLLGCRMKMFRILLWTCAVFTTDLNSRQCLFRCFYGFICSSCTLQKAILDKIKIIVLSALARLLLMCLWVTVFPEFAFRTRLIQLSRVSITRPSKQNCKRQFCILLEYYGHTILPLRVFASYLSILVENSV